MDSVDKEIFKDQKLLTRFIWKLQFQPDTPALIQFVAGDESYLTLCSRIVNAPNDHSRDLQILKEICTQQVLNFQVLREKLIPVARAFGLAEDKGDYYELLGVPRGANTADIKKAFRKSVIKVHPDTGDQISASSAEFINLQTAYQILSDPILRQQYDENLHDVNLWKEKTQQAYRFGGLNSPGSQNANQGQPLRTKIYYQLGGLFLLLIIAVFIFDFLYQQNSIFDGDYNKKQILEGNPLKSGKAHTSDSMMPNKKTEVKSRTWPSDNTRQVLRVDDRFQQTKQTQGHELPFDGSKSNGQ